jgi:NodT family efflux transporter outer membrane factor (OMF) lipoprotein
MRNIFVLLLVAGCGTTSPVLRPDVAPPPAYTEQVAGPAISAGWWNRFESAELRALVDEALEGSPDLAIAMERVRQAEAQVRVAGSSLFPGLNFSMDSRANKDSESSGASLSASYELDLWGRNAAGVSAAEAGLRATTYDRESARLTLISGVANAYFDILSLRGRLAVARENLAIAERVLALVEVRRRNGAVSALDVERQQAAILSQRAALPALEQQERQTLAALALLLGRAPQGFAVQAAGVEALAIPAVSPGLPAELLTRRPDLAAAEASLAAANADLTAARAQLLPSITLTGSAGVASGTLLAFASGGTSTLAVAASVLQPIFDGGRRRAGVTLAESRERELVESYRKAILAALADVENALVATTRLAEREALQAEAARRSREALRLAEVRYREGADDLLSVLDAQRTLFNAEDQAAQARLDRLQAAVALYKALGGGWQQI